MNGWDLANRNIHSQIHHTHTHTAHQTWGCLKLKNIQKLFDFVNNTLSHFITNYYLRYRKQEVTVGIKAANASIARTDHNFCTLRMPFQYSERWELILLHCIEERYSSHKIQQSLLSTAFRGKETAICHNALPLTFPVMDVKSSSCDRISRIAS